MANSALHRQVAVVQDRLHGDARGHRVQFDPGDQPLIDPVEIVHVRRHHLQHVVVIAGDAEEIDDIGDGGDFLAEALQPFGRMVADAHHHEHRQPQPHRRRIQPDRAALDDSRRFQRLQPAPAGVLRHADLIGQIALRQPGIALQHPQDAAINLIQFVVIFHSPDPIFATSP